MPPLKPTNRSSARAFTLIELLTVIAIIGILAAIIIPTVGKVRATARNAQCVSRLRDWGRAIMLYANENKGRYQCENWLSAASNPYQDYFPKASSGSSGIESWGYCPAVNESLYVNNATFNRRVTYAMVVPSINGNITNFLNADPYKTQNTIIVKGRSVLTVPLSRAAQPSQFLMMCDSMGGASTAFRAEASSIATPIDPMFGRATPAADRGGAEVAERHGRQKINGLFGDSSVRLITGSPLGSGDRNSFYERFNTWLQLY